MPTVESPSRPLAADLRNGHLVFVVEYEPKPLSADDLERATSDKPSHRKPLSGPDRL